MNLNFVELISLNVWLKASNGKAQCDDMNGITRIFLSYIA